MTLGLKYQQHLSSLHKIDKIFSFIFILFFFICFFVFVLLVLERATSLESLYDRLNAENVPPKLHYLALCTNRMNTLCIFMNGTEDSLLMQFVVASIANKCEQMHHNRWWHAVRMIALIITDMFSFHFLK